jgi:hypothetical protein
VLGLEINALHLRVDDINIVELEGRVGTGHRAYRDSVEEIHSYGVDSLGDFPNNAFSQDSLTLEAFIAIASGISLDAVHPLLHLSRACTAPASHVELHILEQPSGSP